MENELYWLWLTTLPGVTGYDITALLENFESASDIYKEENFDEIVGIKPSVKSRLKDKSLKKAQAIYDKVVSIGGKVITFESKDYPDALRLTENPPYVLYLRGELPKWDRLLMIGVVGTRYPSQYGVSVTKKICASLAESGVTIVSGMARGVDAVAARTALESGGKTIAVLGCGIDRAYPSENRQLMCDIMENGAVISEYPPGAGPLKHHFPERNRIISGLSKGILVTEAPKRSGALITANYAMESGRDLFAVPGSIFEKNSVGTNAILSSCAKAVSSARDILDEYVYEVEHLNLEKPKAKIFDRILGASSSKTINNEIKISLDDKKYQGLSESEKSIIALLLDDNMHIDDIKRNSGIEITKLTPMLSMLEFGGYIKKLPGNNYKLNI